MQNDFEALHQAKQNTHEKNRLSQHNMTVLVLSLLCYQSIALNGLQSVIRWKEIFTHDIRLEKSLWWENAKKETLSDEKMQKKKHNGRKH